MTVIWSATAQFRLDEIYSWIAADDKEAAARLIARIIDHADQIAAFSMSGRVVPEFNMPQIREVMEGPSVFSIRDQSGGNIACGFRFRTQRNAGQAFEHLGNHGLWNPKQQQVCRR